MAVLLTAVGGWTMLFPHEFVAQRSFNDHFKSERSFVQKVSKNECRVYGLVCFGTGILLGGLAIYPLKR